MEIEKKRRIQTLLKNSSILLLALLGYAFLVKSTGFFIPCPLYATTHLYCGGCGVSRMCFALLDFRFADAFRYNPVIFCLLPFFGLIFLDWCRRYIITGSTRLPKYQECFLYFAIGLLVIFTILRNIPFFSFLAP